MALSDEDVREILRIIDESTLTELRIETEGFSLHVRQGAAQRGCAGADPARRTRASGVRRPAPAPSEPPAHGRRPCHDHRPDARARSTAPRRPGKPPFVEVGQRVEPDTIVCIIEVMKMMNSVTAGVSGTIAEVVAGERRARRVRPAAVPGGAGVKRIKRVFVANRGEIALRIVNACQELGPRDRGRYLRGRPHGLAARPRRPGGVHRAGARRARATCATTWSCRPRSARGCDAIHPGLRLPVGEPEARGARAARTD